MRPNYAPARFLATAGSTTATAWSVSWCCSANPREPARIV